MGLPSIAAFQACCGASIVYGFFTNDPKENSGFKLDQTGYGYQLDEKGERIPVSFADKFKEDMAREAELKRSYMWCCILTEAQLNQFDGAWKQILHDTGFVPVRRWYNYNHQERELLHLFTLVADFKGKCKGDFSTPPKGWDKLSEADANSSSLIEQVKAASLPKVKAA